MRDEEKFYGLMAQAEEIQEHAVALQKMASEAIEAHRKEMRYRGLFWAICGAAIVVVVGVLGCLTEYGVARWVTADLEAEAERLRQEVAELEASATQLADKTWGLELVNFEDEGTRGIILPKGTVFLRSGPIRDGRTAVVITSPRSPRRKPK